MGMRKYYRAIARDRLRAMGVERINKQMGLHINNNQLREAFRNMGKEKKRQLREELRTKPMWRRVLWGNRLLRHMQKYGAEKGTMTVKISVSLEDQELDNGEQGAVPTFEHKVATTVQIKDESSGKLSGNYVLEEDGKGGFVIRPLVDQMDMFDLW